MHIHVTAMHEEYRNLCWTRSPPPATVSYTECTASRGSTLQIALISSRWAHVAAKSFLFAEWASLRALASALGCFLCSFVYQKHNLDVYVHNFHDLEKDNYITPFARTRISFFVVTMTLQLVLCAFQSFFWLTWAKLICNRELAQCAHAQKRACHTVEMITPRVPIFMLCVFKRVGVQECAGELHDLLAKIVSKLVPSPRSTHEWVD